MNNGNRTDKNSHVKPKWPADTPKWFEEALTRQIDASNYIQPDKKELNFLYHPARALFSTFFSKRNSSKGRIANSPFEKAEGLYLGSEFSDRENAIASAFFELGMAYDRVIALDHIDRELHPKKSAGKKSKPEYEDNKQEIIEIMYHMIKNKLRYKVVQKEIENLTSISPGTDSIRKWRDNLSKGVDIFSPKDTD